MRNLRTFFVSLFCLSAFAAAQSAQPHLDPNNRPDKSPPSIVFTLDFPQATPPFYNIAIESSGNAEYKSTPQPKDTGDPYQLRFVASQATAARLFDLARQVNFFQGNFDYTRRRVAFTGTKTLYFRNATDEHQTSYNWSDNPQIQEITTIFQNISETIELGRQLADKYRFDKLGVDAILKTLEDEARSNHLAEIQSIQPTLTRIVKDPSVMNISRRRAEFLLSKIPPGATIASQSSSE